jgi:hypothetical protein
VPALAELLRPGHGVLGGPAGGYAVLEAARDLGPAARPLIPVLLTPFLADSAFCPSRPRRSCAPGWAASAWERWPAISCRRPGPTGGGGHEHALGLLREIQGLDREAVSPAMLRQLCDVAERPARVIRSGLADNVIKRGAPCADP